jgi:hypothetical protein
MNSETDKADKADKTNSVYVVYMEDCISESGLKKRLESIKKLIENIDLTRCSPTPWGTRAFNSPIGESGEVVGYTDLYDDNGETILSTDRENDTDVEVDGWFNEVHLYTAAQAVNAIAKLQEMFGINKGGNNEQ